MFEIPHNHYRDTSYRPDRIPKQPTPQGKPKGIGAMASRLPWGNTQEVIPMYLMMASDPAELSYLEKYYQKQQSLISEIGSAINHQFILPPNFTKGTKIALLAYSFGKPVTFIMSAVMLLMYLFFFVFSKENETLLEIVIYFLPILYVFVGIPLFIWLVTALYLRLFSSKKGKGSAWELNRETGLVTVSKEKNGQRVAHTHPFYEWDGYLITIPNRQGFAYYGFWLQHRYSDLTIKDLMDTADKGSQQEIWATWYFLQNYMDVSRPLPDDGGLEMFRPYDPTTVEYDNKTKRNPYYWRNIPHPEWETKCKEMARSIQSIYINPNNIMAEFVDYSRM